MKRSKFLKLNGHDLLKGAIIAAGTAISFTLIPILQAGQLPTIEQLKSGGIAALCAGIVYLLKNLFTNTNGTIAKAEAKQ